jgi:hypothetical protein
MRDSLSGIEEWAPDGMRPLKKETIENLRARFEECSPFSREFDIPVTFALVQKSELEEIFPENDSRHWWSNFAAKYPGATGFITLSQIGFDKDMSQALVYTGSTSADTCGSGGLVYLTNDHGIWKVRKFLVLWVY